MHAGSTDPGTDDYALIESAVMETSRGRWFLAEYARRNRNADTAAVLEALSRIENRVEAPRAGAGESIRLELIDMANAIARTKSEIAAIRPSDGDNGRIGDATNELDAIVKATETATSDILAAAEHLQEVAWTLRESGLEGAACDIIDQRATDIYMACSFQDITGQRTQKVIQVLRYIEHRLEAMMAVWSGGAVEATPEPAPPMLARGDGLLNGPALPGEGLDQTDVDTMLSYSGDATGGVVFDPIPVAPHPAPVDLAPMPAMLEPAPIALDPLPIALDPIPVTLDSIPLAPEPVPVDEPALLADIDAVATTDEALAIPSAPEPVREEPPALVISPPPAPSPFTAVTKPKTKAKAEKTAIVASADRPTMADIDALTFDEKAALFS